MSVWQMALALALGVNLAVVLCVLELALLGVLAGFLQAVQQRGRACDEPGLPPRFGTGRHATPLRPAPMRPHERPGA